MLSIARCPVRRVGARGWHRKAQAEPANSGRCELAYMPRLNFTFFHALTACSGASCAYAIEWVVARLSPEQVVVGWLKVSDLPERWEHPSFGAVEARGTKLWAMLPTCGHEHAFHALDLDDAKRQCEEREGRCYRCWIGQTPVTGEVPILPRRK